MQIQKPIFVKKAQAFSLPVRLLLALLACLIGSRFLYGLWIAHLALAHAGVDSKGSDFLLLALSIACIVGALVGYLSRYDRAGSVFLAAAFISGLVVSVNSLFF